MNIPSHILYILENMPKIGSKMDFSERDKDVIGWKLILKKELKKEES